MNKHYTFKLNQLYAVMILFSSHNAFSAANFNIQPFGTLPTNVPTGQTINAYFTITNMTHTARNGYVIQGLPTTVTQNTTGPNCGNPINLGPNPASCQLQLDITGDVSANFAICNGNSCTTSSTPLNVSSGSYFSYVSDISSNLWQCPMNATGGISGGACMPLTNATSPGFATISDVTFATFSGVTYAYVADGSPNLWQCPMNAAGGISNGRCIALTNATSPNFSQTNTTTFATFSGVTYAYVTDRSENLWQCPMNAAGGISGGACTALTNATSSGFIITNDATFATFSGTTYAYVADDSAYLWQCPMNATGGISGGACILLTNATFPGFGAVLGTSFATFFGTIYAYVADATANLWQCPMNATGGISGGACTPLTNATSPGFSLTESTTFATFNGILYAYVSDSSPDLWQCPMNATGGISDGVCTLLSNTTFPNFLETAGLAFFAP